MILNAKVMRGMTPSGRRAAFSLFSSTKARFGISNIFERRLNSSSVEGLVQCRGLEGIRSFANNSTRLPATSFQQQALPFRSIFAKGFATWASGSRPDIGARARALQQKRMWTIALGGATVACFVIIVLNTFQESLMFYITPTEALEKFSPETAKKRFRLGGLVLEGSVRHFANSTEMEFIVTDLATEILVRYQGALPDLFREGHSVVAEGFLKPFSKKVDLEKPPVIAIGENSDEKMESHQRALTRGCFFAAAEVLAKHDEKYMPKEVAAAVARNREVIESAEKANPQSPEAVLGAPLVLQKSGRPSKLSKVAQAPSQVQQYDIGG